MTRATEVMALRAECERLAQENARLREALRECYIDHYLERGVCVCNLCSREWPDTEPERHAPGCLADKGEQG